MTSLMRLSSRARRTNAPPNFPDCISMVGNTGCVLEAPFNLFFARLPSMADHAEQNVLVCDQNHRQIQLPVVCSFSVTRVSGTDTLRKRKLAGRFCFAATFISLTHETGKKQEERIIVMVRLTSPDGQRLRHKAPLTGTRRWHLRSLFNYHVVKTEALTTQFVCLQSGKGQVRFVQAHNSSCDLPLTLAIN